MTQVRTSPDYPQSNGKPERWNKSIKSECIRPGVPLAPDDAERLITQYVDVYNHERRHSPLGCVTPKDMLERWRAEIHAARDRKLEQAQKKNAATARRRCATNLLRIGKFSLWYQYYRNRFARDNLDMLSAIMMRSVFAALAVIAGAALPACCSTILIDFDNVASGPIASNALVSYGIDSITSSAGSIAASVNRCGAGCSNVLPGTSHSYLASAGGTFPSPTGTFSTTLLFHDATSYFSFFKSGYSVNTVGVAGWETDAYDANNNLVASAGVGLNAGLDYPPSPTPVQYTLTDSLAGSAGITKVVILAHYNFQSTTGNLQTDFFQFQTPGTPEPASVILAAGGLAVLVAFRRYRSCNN